MEINRDKISKRLINLRGERSQSEIARALGISTSTLAMYESGKRVPRDELKIKLAEFYGADIKELFFAS